MIKTSTFIINIEAATKPSKCEDNIATLPLSQGDIRYVTLWIPLILGVKVLHMKKEHIHVYGFMINYFVIILIISIYTLTCT